MNRILEKLERRAKNRPGELYKFPLTFKRNNEDSTAIETDELIYIITPFQNEHEMAAIAATNYVETMKAKEPTVFEDAITMELLVHSIRDASDAHEKIFKSANDIRLNMTKEEIAELLKLMNRVVWKHAPQKIVENREDALMIAQAMADAGNAAALDQYNIDTMIEIIKHLAKEIQELNHRLEPKAAE